MAKPNYHHLRRQKELARKTRQQEKQQKRLVPNKDSDPDAPPDETGVDAAAGSVVTDSAGAASSGETTE